jgi:hypothetical protein
MHCTGAHLTSHTCILLRAYALHTYRLIPPPASNVIFRSISAGLEIEGLIEIGVKVCIYSQRKKGLILGAWAIM